MLVLEGTFCTPASRVEDVGFPTNAPKPDLCVACYWLIPYPRKFRIGSILTVGLVAA